VEQIRCWVTLEDDWLVGGTGSDVLSGGTDADCFVFFLVKLFMQLYLIQLIELWIILRI
jgi:hypothetical protein